MSVPPPPVPRPPVGIYTSWLLSDEGESCTARCARSGAMCNLEKLLAVSSATDIKIAASDAGEDCRGGYVGWAYASNPGVCTHGGCCGDSDGDGLGDCEQICAYGTYGVSRTCEASSAHYSRLCPCATVLSPSAPPPPTPPYMASPPPPAPRPPLSTGDWILSEEGTSCTAECQASGGVCDAARLQEITSEEAILAAAAAAGVACSGGAVGWAYASNPAICTHGRCCGDGDGDGYGDCEGICAWGRTSSGASGVSPCDAVSQDYSRLCACNPTSPRPPPPPPLPPGSTPCRTSSQCSWPQSYCQCNEPYAEGPGGSVTRCAGGQCRLARDFVFTVVQQGGSCVGSRIWWRHHYVTSGAADTTLNADDDTGNLEVAARLAIDEPRCGGGELLQWSPAYSWEWGFFCCQAGAATVANNPNWNVIAVAALRSPSPPPPTPPPPLPPPLPPPPPPTPPPLPPLPSTAASLQVGFQLAGQVSDFDSSSFRADLMTQFPEAISIVLNVSAGSVVVEAHIAMRTNDAATAAAASIAATSPAEMASAWFGGRVEITATPTAIVVAASEGGDAGDDMTRDLVDHSASQLGVATAGGDGLVTWRVDGLSLAIGIGLTLALMAAAFVVARAVIRRRKQRQWRAPAGLSASVQSSTTSLASGGTNLISPIPSPLPSLVFPSASTHATLVDRMVGTTTTPIVSVSSHAPCSANALEQEPTVPMSGMVSSHADFSAVAVDVHKL